MSTKHPHPENLRTLPNGRYADTEVKGLYLVVENADGTAGSGNRNWKLRYQLGDKRQLTKIADIKTLSQSEARKRARTMILKLKADGVDPREAAQAAKTGVLFIDWCNENIGTGRDNIGPMIKLYSPSEQKQWWLAVRRLEKLHKMQVHAIKVEHVENALKEYWEKIPPSARTTQQKLARIFRTLKARGLYKGDNPADYENALKDRLVLHSISKLHKTRHHPSLPFARLPQLMMDLYYDPATSARVLELIILCAGRQSEVRRMEVKELDLAAGKWTIPGAKMKADRDHVVALAPRVVELLREQLKRIPKGSQYVFPTDHADAKTPHYSPNGVRLALARRNLLVEHDGEQVLATVHGMRASFRTYCTRTPVLPQMQREAAEFALSHKVFGDTEGSYADQMFEERMPLMTAWSEYCLSEVPAGAPKAKPDDYCSTNVIRLRGKAA